VTPPYQSGDSFESITPITPIPYTSASSSPPGTPHNESGSSGTASNGSHSTGGSVSSASTNSSHSVPNGTGTHIQPSDVFAPEITCPSSRSTYSSTASTKQSVYNLRSPTSSSYPPSPQNQYTDFLPVSPVIGRSLNMERNFDSTAGHTPPYRSEEADGLSLIATSAPPTVRSYRSFDNTVASSKHPDSPIWLSPTGTVFSHSASELPTKTIHPSFDRRDNLASTTYSFSQ
jgi:hypothetical protein